MPKTVLITGAGGNLGRAVVERFLADSYQVIATIRPGSKGNFSNPGVKRVGIDLTNERAVGKCVDDIAELNAAILLAGGFAMGSLAETDGDALDKMIRINFHTAYFAARPVIKKMMNQPLGGRIVLVGSKAALQPGGKSMVAYDLSKSLLFRFAEILNAEGASKNVVTHVVAPSIIDTPENRTSMPDADFTKWVTPQQIADVMAFACSEKGSVLRDAILKVYGDS